jgi:hypothetical protein
VAAALKAAHNHSSNSSRRSSAPGARRAYVSSIQPQQRQLLVGVLLGCVAALRECIEWHRRLPEACCHDSLAHFVIYVLDAL